MNKTFIFREIYNYNSLIKNVKLINKMKKNRIISIFSLGLILAFLINPTYSLAQTGYVGVAVGDQKTWYLVIHGAGIKSLLEDTGAYDEIPEQYKFIFGTNYDTRAIATVESISDEMTEESLNFYNINLSLSVRVTVEGVTELYVEDFIEKLINGESGEQEIPTIVMDPSTSNFIYNLYILTNTTGCLPGLIMPVGLDWDQAINDFNDILSLLPVDIFPFDPSDLTITALSNGFKLKLAEMTISSDEGDMIIKSIEITGVYDSNGWLSKITVSYGGKIIISMQEDPGGIPGFDLIAFFGIGGLVSLYLILIANKKAKNKRS